MLKCIACGSQIEPGRQGASPDPYDVLYSLHPYDVLPFVLWYGRVAPVVACLPCTESHARAEGAWREEEAS